MHTAEHLVRNALSGPLADGRTFVLVTHHITLCLPITSHLLELSKGKALHFGSIEQLKAAGTLEDVIEEEEEPFMEEEAPAIQPVQIQNEADVLNKDDLLEDPKAAPTKLIEEEYRAEGKVSTKTYMAYIKAAGYICWTLTFALMLAIRFINIGNQVFLARWGEAYEKGSASLIAFVAPIQTTMLSYPWDGFPSPSDEPLPWLLVYLYISVAGAVCVLLYIALGYYASLQASRKLFTSLLQRLTRAPSVCRPVQKDAFIVF